MRRLHPVRKKVFEVQTFTFEPIQKRREANRGHRPAQIAPVQAFDENEQNVYGLVEPEGLLNRTPCSVRISRTKGYCGSANAAPLPTAS